MGRKVIANNINGYLASQCVFYLMNIHIRRRTIWLTRHGQSQYNLEDRIGGDPPLTERGQRYARALAKFMSARHPHDASPMPPATPQPPHVASSSSSAADGAPGRRAAIPSDPRTLQDPGNATVDSTEAEEEGADPTWLARVPSSPRMKGVLIRHGGDHHSSTLTVWTSLLKRTVETSQPLRHLFPTLPMRVFNEIYAGNMENLTYAEIQHRFPDEFAARHLNKLSYRYELLSSS